MTIPHISYHVLTMAHLCTIHFTYFTEYWCQEPPIGSRSLLTPKGAMQVARRSTSMATRETSTLSGAHTTKPEIYVLGCIVNVLLSYQADSGRLEWNSLRRGVDVPWCTIDHLWSRNSKGTRRKQIDKVRFARMLNPISIWVSNFGHQAIPNVF